jgi:hypothetical protein
LEATFNLTVEQAQARVEAICMYIRDAQQNVKNGKKAKTTAQDSMQQL